MALVMGNVKVLVLSLLALLDDAEAKLGTLHFGCNTSGPENATQLQELGRYSMPILEFRQSCCGGAAWDDEERVLNEQAFALRDATEGRQLAWVYRNVNAGSMFRLQRQIMNDPNASELFLGESHVDPKYNISWRSFNFSNLAAKKFFLDVVVAEAAGEQDVAGVFFDGIDGGCGSASEQLYNDTIRVFKEACELLRSSGKSCVLSAISAFEGLDVLNSTGCPLPQEAMVEIMDSTPWYRYYQHWLNGFVGHSHAGFSSQICSAMLQNQIREGALGVPTVVRAASDASVYAVDLQLALAGFLMGATEDSTFGYGSCWFDECWQWHSIYDREFGVPLAPATVSQDGMRFARRWSGVDVTVDCRIGNSTVNFRVLPNLQV